MKVKWNLKQFDQLTPKMIWQIYNLREEVFIIEQKSLYPDIDKQDLRSYHVFATDDQDQLVAYARFYRVDSGVSFGRVVVPRTLRGTGLGKELVQKILSYIKKIYGHTKIVIAAQYYARGFYQQLGFRIIGNSFTEALRKHIRMFLSI